MADTTTPVYSFVLPEIDGSDGTWGTKLNANLTALDGLLSCSANLQNASFTGTASFGGSTGTAGQVLKSQGAGANAIWTDDSNTTYTAGSGLSLTGTEFANTAPDQTVVMNAGSGISVSGTYPTFTVTNSSPDQTVALTGTGGTTISGTYPNFTINSTDTNTTYTAGTGLTLTSTEFSVTDNGIGALQLNVSGNGTSGQVLASDGDGSFSWTSAGTGGNETLAQTLALGAVTGGTDISVSSGDNIVMAANSTVDGRDVSVDGTKLDGIEASADVTDTANVTAAGALMDSELTSEASVKALDQGVATTDSPTFAAINVNGLVTSDDFQIDLGTTTAAAEITTPSSISGFQALRVRNTHTDGTLAFGTTLGQAKIQAYGANGTADPLNIDVGSITAIGIDATGQVGIGTASPNRLLEANSTQQVVASFKSTSTDSARISFSDANTTDDTKVTIGSVGDALKINTLGSERMRIDSSGNVGVGTTAPSSFAGDCTLALNDSGGARLGLNGSSRFFYMGCDSGSDRLEIGRRISSNTTDSPDFVLNGSGQVGIGTTSPEYNLDVTADDNVTTTTALSVQNSSRNYGLGLGAYTLTNRNIGGSATTVDYTFDIGRHAIFKTNNAERVRIDSSGNLLVGTTTAPTALATSTNSSDTGVSMSGTGRLSVANSNSYPLALNRYTSEGSMIQLNEAGVTRGSIGIKSNEVYIADSVGGLRMSGSGTNNVIPCNSAGTGTDNATDLGASGNRFDDIYATNGTIQTSDRNEKQDIVELSEAEQRVAVACKGLLRKFRWKDSVAKKGDDARIHFGIIAQDLQAAFAAEGLDAGDYAMFISTTWWEQDVEVPAVEAVEAVYETQTDEEGNETQVLISEAIESVDAYTETHNYSTIEEAPEGATEKTRLGVRYSELLAFIIAAL